MELGEGRKEKGNGRASTISYVTVEDIRIYIESC
jgi:hypothetical protein